MNLPAYVSVLRQVWGAPGNAAHRPSALLRAFRWFRACRRQSGKGKPVLLPVFGSRLFPCYTDSIIAKHVMYRSEWFDYDLLHFMHDYLRADDHYLDVGANTGLHTLLASTRVTSGRITCVEPDPRNLDRLRHALELNRITNATVLPLAAADVAGEAMLDRQDVFTRIAPDGARDEFQPRERRQPAASAVAVAEPPDGVPRRVDTARLDEVLERDAHVDLCKIDVEGAEWQVLRGLTGLMARDALPVIIFELNASLHAYGHTEAGFLNWLREQGYHLATYRHDRRSLTFQEPFTDNDVFAFTDSGLARVKERMPMVHRVDG